MVPAPTALNEFKRLPALADAVRLDELRGTRVVTEGGELLGTVSDLDVDGEARHVLSYVLRGSVMQRLRHREPTIPVWQVTHRSDRGLIVMGANAASEVNGESR
jgi:sporulation protein YlmC with PRC-barrel domain